MTDPRYPIGPYLVPEAYPPELRASFIADLAETPARLRAAVEGLSKTQLATPYRDGGWTVAQVVHHLADSHMNSYIRFKLAVTEAQPTIKPYEEALWAALPDASSTDLEDSLALLEALHRRWTAFLRTLTGVQLQRTFLHPEAGVVSLDRNLGLYAWHGRHHVAHITNLRALKGW
jgi:uncharacterized damage-inducible protein DinB